jgi:hypothetical protein
MPSERDAAIAPGNRRSLRGESADTVWESADGGGARSRQAAAMTVPRDDVRGADPRSVVLAHPSAAPAQ